MDKEIKREFNRSNKRFDKIDKTLGKLNVFLQKEMLTKNEVKEMIANKSDKADVDKILSSQDGIAKQIKDYHQEMVFLVRRVEQNGRLDKKSFCST